MAQALIRGEFGTGWKPQLPDIHDKVLSAARFGGAVIPAHRDDRASMPPVYNQKNTNSCTGQGTAGALQYMRRKQGLEDFIPSRMFIYYNGRAMDGSQGFDGGSQVRNVIKSVATSGACSETDWTFDTSHINSRPTDKCYTDAKTDLVTSYAAVPQDIDAIRACLAHDIPIVFGFSIYSQFESDAMAQSGMLEMPGTFSIQLGGHCVVACGYSDKSKVVICRNSYGSDWGDKGYFYVPYSYVCNPGLAADFWQIDVVAGK